MILVMYTDSVLNELKTNIDLNIERYKENVPFAKSFINNYDSMLYPLDKEVEYPVLNDRMPLRSEEKKLWEVDYENSVILHKSFILKYKIPIQILSDERFISYLSHDIYFDYMKKRWPESDKKRVKEKYFLPSGSQAFTRNTFLRYFWYSYITYDDKAKDPYHLTKIAFEYADPVNQIMERKYSKNKIIVKAALRAIELTAGAKGLNARRTMYGKAINNILGLYCLDVLKESELVDLFMKEITNIVNLPIEGEKDE